MSPSLRPFLTGRRDSSERADDVGRLNAAPRDGSFITGNGISRRCRWSLNYGPARVHDGGREGWYFCKTDFVDEFFDQHAPESDFVLFTHNSDNSVGAQFEGRLSRPNLRMWFASNVDVIHPKLRSLPVGIANPSWPHGDTRTLRRVQQAASPKTRMFDASFSTATNPLERNYCVEQTGIAPAAAQPYRAYLEGLASSFFCISPRGNGVDCHRTWEALYLRTIPVVTRSIVSEQHRDLPLIVLDDWSEFGSIDFSAELYEQTLGSWSPSELALDRYFERIETVLEQS